MGPIANRESGKRSQRGQVAAADRIRNCDGCRQIRVENSTLSCRMRSGSTWPIPFRTSWAGIMRALLQKPVRPRSDRFGMVNGETLSNVSDGS
jgi:hypothetical protein